MNGFVRYQEECDRFFAIADRLSLCPPPLSDLHLQRSEAKTEIILRAIFDVKINNQKVPEIISG